MSIRGLLVVVGMCSVIFTPAATFAQLPVFDDFSTDPFSSPQARWGRSGTPADLAAHWIAPGSPLCANEFGDGPFVYFDDRVSSASFCGPPTVYPCTVWSQEDVEAVGGEVSTFGFVALTHGRGQHGNIFLPQKVSIDNLRIRVIFSADGGCRFDNPAEGFGITLVELQDPPGAGMPGGGNGLTGYVCPEGATLPCPENDGNGDGVRDGGQQIIFEADYNLGHEPGDLRKRDSDREDHVGIYYIPDGAQALPPSHGIGVTVQLPAGVLLHMRNDVGSEGLIPNRIEMTALVRGEMAAMELNLVDQGIDFGRIAETRLPGLTPFDGYVIAAASTGGRDAGNYLHEIEIENIPGDCDLAPAPATFAHRFVGLQRGEVGDFLVPQRFAVHVDVTSPRREPACPIASTNVRSTLPLGFTVVGVPSASGRVIAPGDPATEPFAVEWNLAPADIAGGDLELSYSVATGVPEGNPAARDFKFLLSYAEATGSQPTVLVSSERVAPATGFDPVCGGITSWNVLGPYRNPYCPFTCNGPGQSDGPTFENLEADFAAADFDDDGIADGIPPWALPWEPGLVVNTAFSPVGMEPAPGQSPLPARSPASGLHPTSLDRDLNPGGVPTVFAHHNGDSYIDFQTEVFGPHIVSGMTYLQCYVYNRSGAEMPVFIKSEASQDFFLQLNGETVVQRTYCRDDCAARESACRGARNPALTIVPQSVDYPTSPIDETRPIFLRPGENTVLVGIWNEIELFYGGVWAFWMRFQTSDDNGTDSVPITGADGLEIRLTPEREAEGHRPGDFNRDALLDLSDVITLLNWLFRGQPLEPCFVDAEQRPTAVGQTLLDFNGDGGAIDLSDAVALIGHLFRGGPPHALGGACVDIGGPLCRRACAAE